MVKGFNLDYGDAITHNFYRLGCVFNVAWSQYNIPGLCNEVTKQANVAANKTSTFAQSNVLLTPR